MDPSLVKFLEEDEDETMHSGADVEAFTAALNRDIKGDNNIIINNNNNDNNNTSTSSQPPPTATTDTPTPLAPAAAAASHTPSQVFQQWQSSKRQEEQQLKPHPQDQHSSSAAAAAAAALGYHHPRPTDTSSSQQHPDPSTTTTTTTTTTNNNNNNNNTNNAASAADNNNNNTKQQQQPSAQQGELHPQRIQQPTRPAAGKQVPFALLLPVIEPQLDKDRAMQLQGLYVRLKSNNINKEEFVRHMRSLVGDHMLKMAVYKLQQGQVYFFHLYLLSNTFDLTVFYQLTNKPMDNKQHQSDSHKPPNVNAIKQERDQPFPMQGGLPKQHQHQQQQHMPFPQSSFANYGTAYSMPSQPYKQQQTPHDLQLRQGPAFTDMKRLHAHFTPNSGLQQTSGHWQPSMHKDQSLMSSMPYAKQESLDQMNDQQQHKSQLSAPQGPSSITPGHLESSKDETFEMMSSRPGFSTSMNKSESMSIAAQLERQNVSAGNSSLASGSNAKTPPKKPTVGQKKPLEAPASSLSKKQKVSGSFSDQSIEQLNDVTAVSGVNLREEEEQLFSGSKEDSRVSEASRKVVQEEEERLILQKTPLQKKLAEIMAKCGVKNRSSDVERCLSLCVEERMRGLISNLIRLSKQRVDIEKPRHQTVVTSDVRKQIMSMNQKAREEWEKKQADAEKLQRTDEPEGSGDGEDGRGKSFKVNKEEDDKMRTTAANVAARAAVGGDDMLSKWQLMAEQARQKREGGPDAGSASQASVDVGPKPQSATERNSKDNPDTERMTLGAVAANPGPVRKITRNQESAKSGSIPRTITVKDVISVLGREIQMSRSTLIYRLYEKVRSDSVSEQ